MITMNMIQNILFRPILAIKAKRIGGAICGAFPKKVSRVLDVGCGDMMISREIKKYIPNAKFIGIDVIDTSMTGECPVLYDGVTLPYPDLYFDVVYTSFVLHHCDDPVQVVSEMKRVCRGRIIIVEEIYTTQVRKYITSIYDWIVNRLESWTVNIPFNFKTDHAWRLVFKEHGLSVIFSKPVSQLPLWFLTHQIMYTLKPSFHARVLHR